MLSTAKQNLVHIMSGGKLRFVKSVSRGDECRAIWTAKAIHHSIKRQSRGNKWETRVDVTKKRVDEKVIMLETQVVSDETNTHQVAICLQQSCGVSSDNFHN